MGEFSSTAMSVGLRKLFPRKIDRFSSFSILDFEKITTIAGAHMTQGERDELALFHCVKYTELPSGERDALFARCIEILNRGQGAGFPSVEETGDRLIPALDNVVPLAHFPERGR